MESCPTPPTSCYSLVNIQNCDRENGTTGLVSPNEITMKIENVAEEKFLQECLAINELENDDLAEIKKDIEESEKESNDENIGEGSNGRRTLRRKKNKRPRKKYEKIQRLTRIYTCVDCPETFSRLSQLRAHSRVHTEDQTEKYECDLCEEVFDRLKRLMSHRKKHHRASDLKVHKRIHAPPKPFRCESCPASFQQFSSLTRHKMIHTGERPLRKKPENKPGSFKETGIKPYACEICNATFCEKRNLKRHIISLHDDVRRIVANPLADAEIKEEGALDKFIKLQQPVQIKKRPPEQITYTINYQNPVVITQPQQIQPQQQEGQQEIQPSITLQHVVIQQPLNTEDVITGTPQTITQMPQLMLAQGPGQAPKPAKPANNCQNHHAHVLTFIEGSYNQWQTWCFCDPPNLIDQPSQIISTVPAANAIITAPPSTVIPPDTSPPPTVTSAVAVSAVTNSPCATVEQL
ncbi:Myoneurin-like 1, partial [Homarus americanus]